jgi:mannose-6-phosphate isomerase
MLYPLRFRPILRQYLWGGRRLAQLGKPLGSGEHYAESWEICDHAADQSVVQAGPLVGKTLHELVSQHGAELLGRHHPLPRFPLLLKFLDAQERLSVQVHPNDQQAARLDPPDLGKTEAWVVLDAEPGSLLYVGLKRGFDRAALQRELARGTCELCLHSLESRPGDCVLVPAGMVHAIGGGLLIAEIQQASDATFRLFDWNRRGPDGKPRPLHVAQALETIDYGLGPGQFQAPKSTENPLVERLVTCDKFLLDRWEFERQVAIGGDGRFHILVVVSGAATVERDAVGEPLQRGGTLLVPAATGPVRLEPHDKTVLLDAYLP